MNNVCMDKYKVLKFLEKNNIPFIFTLYPGGGFCLNNKECDEKLKRIFSSPCFKKVIVTQKTTYNYLIQNNLCSKDKIEFIYGVVTPSKIINRKRINKRTREKTKICFVAYKYSKNGEDKGFDLFVKSIEALRKIKNIEFHVVGNFTEKDVENVDVRNSIQFHGIKNIGELSEFYKDMDIIISPNRSNKLKQGSFDGFPTGTCTEAMLNRCCSSLYR